MHTHRREAEKAVRNLSNLVALPDGDLPDPVYAAESNTLLHLSKLATAVQAEQSWQLMMRDVDR